MKINLGCGTNIRPGFVNIDICKHDGVDIVHNLDVFPWPIKDNSADFVMAFDVLEHVRESEKFLEELHRILKTGGIAEIRVPHFRSDAAYAIFGHRNFYHENAIDWITGKKSSDLQNEKIHFKLLKKKVLRGRIRFWNKKVIIWIIQKWTRYA